MNQTADYIKYPTYIGAESLLTIHEEREIRKIIAQGNGNLSGMTNSQKQKLFTTCRFYLEKSEKKLEYLDLEAKDQFTDIIENGYRRGMRN